jgi:hypothetical protein
VLQTEAKSMTTENHEGRAGNICLILQRAIVLIIEKELM